MYFSCLTIIFLFIGNSVSDLMIGNNNNFVDKTSLTLSSTVEENAAKLLSNVKSWRSNVLLKNSTDVTSKVPFDNPDFIPGDFLNEEGDLNPSERSLEEELRSDFDKTITQVLEGKLIHCVLLLLALFILGIIFFIQLVFLPVSTRTSERSSSLSLRRLKRKQTTFEDRVELQLRAAGEQELSDEMNDVAEQAVVQNGKKRKGKPNKSRKKLDKLSKNNGMTMNSKDLQAGNAKKAKDVEEKLEDIEEKSEDNLDNMESELEDREAELENNLEDPVYNKEEIDGEVLLFDDKDFDFMKKK